MEDINKKLVTDKEDLVEYLMLEHGTELTNLAYTYVRDWGTAEEIIQDVFFKCYQKLDSFRGDASLKTWLYRIAINRCKDEMRKVSIRKIMTQPVSSFFSLRSPTSSPEDSLISKGEKKEIADHVLSLPPKYREVIILYYYSNLKTKEISQLIQVNDKTIRTRLRRARQLLQDKMGEVRQ
ncbi:sigma-70 family RNA polymerase sigma factor [Bacillaceae bacterium W0354]